MGKKLDYDAQLEQVPHFKNILKRDSKNSAFVNLRSPPRSCPEGNKSITGSFQHEARRLEGSRIGKNCNMSERTVGFVAKETPVAVCLPLADGVDCKLGGGWKMKIFRD